MTSHNARRIAPGDRFGLLVVLREVERNSITERRRFRCLCDCGAEVVRWVWSLQTARRVVCSVARHGRADQPPRETDPIFLMRTEVPRLRGKFQLAVATAYLELGSVEEVAKRLGTRHAEVRQRLAAARLSLTRGYRLPAPLLDDRASRLRSLSTYRIAPSEDPLRTMPLEELRDFLTPAQQNMALLFRAGHSQATVARILGVSKPTVTVGLQRARASAIDRVPRFRLLRARRPDRDRQAAA